MFSEFNSKSAEDVLVILVILELGIKRYNDRIKLLTLVASDDHKFDT